MAGMMSFRPGANCSSAVVEGGAGPREKMRKMKRGQEQAGQQGDDGDRKANTPRTLSAQYSSARHAGASSPTAPYTKRDDRASRVLRAAFKQVSHAGAVGRC
jgi:hypothetical protein